LIRILVVLVFLTVTGMLEGTGNTCDVQSRKIPAAADKNRVAEKSSAALVLEQIAKGEAPGGTKFGMKRIRRGGTPLFWEETISIELGGKVGYSSVRSFVDAADWPIGVWEGPAEDHTIRALAQSLLQTKFWDIPSGATASGGEENRWECTLNDGKITLSVGSGSGVLMTMSPVDTQFRRIANDLIASRRGSALKCELTIQQEGITGWAQVALVNEGSKDFQIQNPFKGADDKINFLRVEVGAAPEETPGVTGSDILYKPLANPDMGKPSSPWDQDCIVLKAGEKILCPFQVRIDLRSHRGHYVRAIYSHYGSTAVYPDLTLVRGRAFSKEIRLK
jgi:hypothetical protein